MTSYFQSHPFDFLVAVSMVGLTVLASLTYLLRMAFFGKVQFARVEKQGGSPLLGKSLMAMAYWSILPIGKLLVLLKIHPHVISWASLFLGVAAGVALSQGRFGLGALLAMVSAFFDTLDGMVARMMKVDSNTGEILDTSVDRYCEFFYLGGLIFYYRLSPALMVVALFALAGSFMVSYSTAKAEALSVTPSRGIMRRPERAFYLILGAALSPIAIRYFEPQLSYPVGYPMAIALVLVAALSNVSVIDRMWSIVKQLKEVEKVNPLPQTVADLDPLDES